MSTNDVLNMTRRQPFMPFRIVTTDGTIYEVRHPDLVMVGLSSLIVGYPSEQEPHAFSRWDVVSLRHVIRLEPEASQESPESAEGGQSAVDGNE
jgi:hypothetical protein